MRRLLLLVCAGCTSTETSGPVIAKQFLGWTYSVQPVAAWQGPPWTPETHSWVEQAGMLFGKLTWLLAVGGLLGIYLLYKFPALLRKLKKRRANATLEE